MSATGNNQHITITAKDGSQFDSYLALPEHGEGPGLLLIQEIFGVNAHIRKVANEWAREGYVVLAPDLFHRLWPKVELGYVGKDRETALDYYRRFDEALGIEDLAAAVDTLRQLPQVHGGVAALGFCLGGKLAYLSACRTDADVAIGYYGVGIEDALDEARHLHCPLVLHIAQLDKYCDQAAQEKISRSLGHRDDIQVWLYPDADHAFARPGGEHYHPPSADLALERSLNALQSALKF